MSNIIDKNEHDKHQISKFNFNSFDSSQDLEEKKVDFEDFDTMAESSIKDETNEQKEEEERPQELLEKIEKLSDENVRLELKLESIEKEFQEKLEKSNEEYYQKGREDGLKESTQTLQNDIEELKTRLIKSITQLDEKAYQLENELDSSKNELLDAAILIAKKVIKKELDTNSSLIAKNIAISIIDELKDSTSITIKTNPEDASFLEETFKDKKIIKIEADDAINKGGIIILSNIGNVDSDIKSRLQKAIALLKEEE